MKKRKYIIYNRTFEDKFKLTEWNPYFYFFYNITYISFLRDGIDVY